MICSNATTVELLSGIWRRVLQKPDLSAGDNFFELGGDPSSAVRLFSEIGRAFGREVSPLLVYRAPTVEALAALLELPGTPRFPPVVLLRAGAQEPPLFLAHGLGGSMFEFFGLVKHIPLQSPIYGLQATGLDGVAKPFETIEEMAQFHLEWIQKLQDRGPYLLVGYSLGGLVMLEISQRLLAAGQEVSLLAMLDTYPHISRLVAGQRARLSARLARRYVTRAIEWPIHAAVARFASTNAASAGTHRDSGSESVRRTGGTQLAPGMKSVRDGSQRALTRYRPRFYKGTIRFVRAEVPSVFPYDPSAVWGHLTDRLEIETVPGDHVGMLTTHYDVLGSVLSRYLEEAGCQT
jgi:acetoacetyl-CoA synthetase